MRRSACSRRASNTRRILAIAAEGQEWIDLTLGYSAESEYGYEVGKSVKLGTEERVRLWKCDGERRRA